MLHCFLFTVGVLAAAAVLFLAWIGFLAVRELWNIDRSISGMFFWFR